MKKDKFKILILELLLIVILFFALFAPNIFTRSGVAIIMFIYMFIVVYNLKKRSINSICIKHVRFLMLILGMLYVAIFYLLGLYFGFTKAKVILSIWSFFRFIIPLSVIIISAEVIRKTFLSQKAEFNIKSLKINISPILTYIAMVLIEMLIYTGVYDLTNLDDFLIALGFVLFAALSGNLLFNYIAIRFGCISNIIFRLITILFIYIIPITPNIYMFFRTFLRLLYPYFIYLILEKNYSSNDFTISYHRKKREIIGTSILLLIMTSFIMLISCQFRYGILVIGSKSMTGTLNMGDSVIFEKYKEQDIKLGQIVVFDYNGLQTIHRVIDIKEVNGESRYYTKGDANKINDVGYITDEKIYGLVKLKVKYIGYPTIYVRSLF